jgi:hypothetical protein
LLKEWNSCKDFEVNILNLNRLRFSEEIVSIIELQKKVRLERETETQKDRDKYRKRDKPTKKRTSKR